MFVVVRPAGDEAAITTASPIDASPCACSPRSISAIMPSVSAGGVAGSASTPHCRHSGALHVHGRHERVHRHARPFRGQEPRRAAGLRVARDRDDAQVSGGDRRGRVGHRGALARVAAAGLHRAERRRPPPRRRRRSSSRPTPIRTGSRRRRSRPDSITASAPSSTAFATSVASARVGRGAWIIDSSIWVATIDGPAGRARRAHELLLDQRDLLHRQFHTEVAAGDHHRVGLRKDALDVRRPPGASRSSRRSARTGRPSRRAARARSAGARTNDCATRSTPRSRARASPSRSRCGDRGQAEALGGHVDTLPASHDHPLQRSVS